MWLAARDFAPFWDGGDETAGAAQRVDRFDGRRAFRLLREQVERYGHRPAGSPELRRLAVRLRAALPDGRFEDLPDSLDRTDRLRNVVGRLPGRRPAVVVGAHYDVEAEPEGFVGANDGEEEPAGCDDFERCGIRGSRAYVREHADEVGALVLLDYVAEKGARFPREGSSDPELWSRLRASARRTGNATFFPAEVGASIIDDHTPFLQEGIPAVDVIDFDYPHRDTLRDTVDKTSARTLDAVGETVVDLLLRWR